MRPIALLINFTGLEGHVGMMATSNAIASELTQKGFDLDTVGVNDMNQKLSENFIPEELFLAESYNTFITKNEDLVKSIQSSDIIVVNGEGTIHGVGRRALGLMFITILASVYLKRLTYIINFSCFPNGDKAFLKSYESEIYNKVFSLLSEHKVSFVLRDPISFAILKSFNLKCQLGFDCLPLAITQMKLPARNKEASTFYISGGVNIDTESMVRISSALNICMSKFNIKDMSYILPGTSSYINREKKLFLAPARAGYSNLSETICNDFQSFASVLLKSGAVLVTGRFHYVIAAATLGIPVVPISSNTMKIEAIADIIGINHVLSVEEAKNPDILEKAIAEEIAKPRTPRYWLSELASNNFKIIPSGNLEIPLNASSLKLLHLLALEKETNGSLKTLFPLKYFEDELELNETINYFLKSNYAKESTNTILDQYHSIVQTLIQLEDYYKLITIMLYKEKYWSHSKDEINELFNVEFDLQLLLCSTSFINESNHIHVIKLVRKFRSVMRERKLLPISLDKLITIITISLFKYYSRQNLEIDTLAPLLIGSNWSMVCKDDKVAILSVALKQANLIIQWKRVLNGLLPDILESISMKLLQELTEDFKEADPIILFRGRILIFARKALTEFRELEVLEKYVENGLNLNNQLVEEDRYKLIILAAGILKTYAQRQDHKQLKYFSTLLEEKYNVVDELLVYHGYVDLIKGKGWQRLVNGWYQTRRDLPKIITTSSRLLEDKRKNLLMLNQNLLVWTLPALGIGGEIMYLRSLLFLEGRMNQLSILCDKRIHKAISRKYPSIKFVSEDDTSLDYTEISAPELFGSYFETIQKKVGPWLLADSQYTERIKARYKKNFGFKHCVGISWYTPNHMSGISRCIPIATLRMLIQRHPDIQFISLQHNPISSGAFELERDGLYIDSEIDPTENIDGLLAQISALKSVVSISNSVAHMTGAMGLPFLFLVAKDPTVENMFLSHGVKNTPIYPSAHLIWQNKKYNWEQPLLEVSKMLKKIK